MPLIINISLFSSLMLLVSMSHLKAAEAIDTIAFGSCLQQDNPQPVWHAINAVAPDVFLLIGDNVYADTEDPAIMRMAYAKLASQPGFQQLKASTRIHATWDDHDYGKNDAGVEFPAKATAEEIFVDFFGFPEDAPIRDRPGIYNASIYGKPGQRVQLIFLDTRYFRSSLISTQEATAQCPNGAYGPNLSQDATLLGEAQWQWLEKQLRHPAELRIVISSIQVIPDQHCFEKWANFPLERDRLFSLISMTKANGVIFLSGDRHFAEISALQHSIAYPLYEVTSSGLNSAGAGEAEENRYRLSLDNFRKNNFGLISINWQKEDPLVSLEVRDEHGNLGLMHSVRLSELQIK